MTMAPEAVSPQLLTVRVAELYYEEDRTQDEIGGMLGITRWKVGRLLTQAREQGIVRIQIVHPQARRGDLEKDVSERFGLSSVVVVSDADSADETAVRVSRAAAEYLAGLRLDGATVGVSWGATVGGVASFLDEGWARNISVAQLNGGMSLTTTVDTAAATAVTIARKGGGSATLLPSPAILELAETRRLIEADRAVASVLDRARGADLLLYSAGVATAKSALVDSGYLTPVDIESLVALGAVGDVVGRYISASGRIVDDALNDRTIGIGLDELRSHDRAVFVVAGEPKHAVALAVVANSLCSTLVTDESTARALLRPQPHQK
jgi:deoxyribonucleoside regulator